MNYGAIKVPDIANGEGCRISLFVSGCRNHCKGCFQPETWDFNFGQKFTAETFDHIMHQLENDWIIGLSILGGEPLEPENLKEVTLLCLAVRWLFPDKSIWLYTGYKWEGIQDLDIIENELVDIVVDGRFHEDKKDISLRFRGSSNQRIIDVKATREKGEVVLWQDSLQEHLQRPSYCSGAQ